MSLLELACGSDRRYLPHVAAMVHSVLEHSGGLPVRVHFLHGPELPVADRRRLERFIAGSGGEVVLHEIAAERVAGLPATVQLPRAVWYRVLLIDRLPIDRILYLDADTLAVDDLSPLWDTPLGDHHVAAVTNVWEPWNEGFPVHGLGLPHRDAYFNSGVLLMNLAAMRADGCAEAVLEYARRRGTLPWGDQDALNAVLAARRLALHPRWNCMNSVLAFPQAAEVFGSEAVAEARERPGIRHFEGPAQNKPWHLLCDGPLAAEYARHRAATPWPRYRREGLTPRNLARLAVRRGRGRRPGVRR